jgi:Phage integrase, N-terminal SAM-like domain
VAYVVSARPPGGGRTWTVVDGSYRTVVPVEEWLEAHQQVWSPNTVRGYATGLAQWWTFLEQRDDTTDWDKLGVPAVSGFLSWLRNGRTLRQALEQAHGENLELRRQLARQGTSTQDRNQPVTV